MSVLAELDKVGDAREPRGDRLAPTTVAPRSPRAESEDEPEEEEVVEEEDDEDDDEDFDEEFDDEFDEDFEEEFDEELDADLINDGDVTERDDADEDALGEEADD